MAIKAVTPNFLGAVVSTWIFIHLLCFHGDIITRNIIIVIRHIRIFGGNFLLQDFLSHFVLALN